MDIEIRHLRVVVAIAESGSFTGAAARLKLPQSAVSTQVARLERRLGTVLFDRSVHGAEPTATGRRLLVHARDVLARVDTLADAMRLEAPTSYAVACYSPMVGRLLDHLAVAVPDGEWAVRPYDPRGSVRELVAGRLDLVVGYSTPHDPVLPPPEAARCVELCVERLHVALAADHPLAGAGSLALADLRDQVWVARTDGPLRDLLVRTCRDAGFDPDIRYACEQNTAVRSVVLSGRAITLSAPVHERAEGLSIVPLRDEAYRTVFAAHPARVDEATGGALLAAARSWYDTHQRG